MNVGVITGIGFVCLDKGGEMLFYTCLWEELFCLWQLHIVKAISLYSYDNKKSIEINPCFFLRHTIGGPFQPALVKQNQLFRFYSMNKTSLISCFSSSLQCICFSNHVWWMRGPLMQKVSVSSSVVIAFKRDF